MRRGPSFWLVALLAFVTLAMSAAWTPVHADKPRMLVHEFSGPGAKRVQGEVIKALGGLVQSVKPGDAVLAELAEGEVSDQRMATMAREVGFDVFLTGTVRKKRRKHRLALTLRAGANGAEIEHFTVDLGRRPRLNARARRRMVQTVKQVLVDLPPIPPEPVPEPEVDEPDDSEVAKDSGPAADTDKAPDKDQQAAIAATSAAAADTASTAAVRATPGKAPDVRRGFELAAGASALGRRLTFAAAQDLDAPPYKYVSNPVPAARVQGELYPVALFGNTGVFSNVGVSFAFERAIGMVSQVEGLAVNIPTTHQRWAAGLQVRVPLGKRHNSTVITAGGGYGQREFYFDRTALMDTTLDIDVPDVNYRMFDPGLAVRFPLGGRMAVQVRGAYLLIRKVGNIDTPESYGTATAYGAEGEAAATLWLTPWLVVHAGAQYMHIDFSFLGDGAKSDRDGDGVADVDSALDQYFSGYMTAGLRF